MSAELRHLYLGHLSRECNRPELAHRVMQERLQKIGATHVKVELTAQNVPCPTLHLGRVPRSFPARPCYKPRGWPGGTSPARPRNPPAVPKPQRIETR